MGKENPLKDIILKEYMMRISDYYVYQCQLENDKLFKGTADSFNEATQQIALIAYQNKSPVLSSKIENTKNQSNKKAV